MQLPAEWSDANYLNIPVFSTGMGSPCVHVTCLVCIRWKSGIRYVRAGWWGYVQHKVYFGEKSWS